MAPRDGAHRIAVLVLEVIEQSDLVMEGGLYGPAVRAVGRAGDRVAVGEQPGARHRVAGVRCGQRIARQNISVAVEDQGSIPRRRHLDDEVGPVDGPGFGRRIRGACRDGAGHDRNRGGHQHEKCLVRPSHLNPPVAAGERWRFSRMLTQQEMNASADLSAIKALTFDVFGTAVDWRSGVAGEAGRIGAARGVNGDWQRLADAWRGLYGPSMDRVRRDELTLAWERLPAWPDAASGLTRLAKRFTVSTLSNGNRSQHTALVRFAGLPFQRLLSAEDFRHYK